MCEKISDHDNLLINRRRFELHAGCFPTCMRVCVSCIVRDDDSIVVKALMMTKLTTYVKSSDDDKDDGLPMTPVISKRT